MKVKLLILLAVLSLIAFGSWIEAKPPMYAVDLSEPGPIGDKTPDTATFNPSISITDGTDTHIIKIVQEPGGGESLRVGLDEDYRIFSIGDYGDVDNDCGLTVKADPTVYIWSAGGNKKLALQWNVIENAHDFLQIRGYYGIYFTVKYDLSSGSMFSYFSDAARELTASGAEQSFMSLAAKINQSSTAAYNGLKINVTETALGDGTTGYGNNLILAGTSTDHDMFKVDNVGRIVLAESSVPAALADHAFLYAKDVGGTGNMFVADAAAGETQISSHNMSLFTPDPNERFPWSFYAENKALGVKINVDMAGMVRAVEALSGKKFIHYADIVKSVDLESVYRAQWKREWIRNNTTTDEVAKVDAFKLVEQDVRTMYDVEIVDEKTKQPKIVKRGKKIGEKITGYELVENEVKPKIEAIWETHKEQVAQLKEGFSFNKTDGKFYKRVVPIDIQAEAATTAGFVFQVPAWLADRLKK